MRRFGPLCACTLLLFVAGLVGCGDDEVVGPTASDYQKERARVAAQIKKNKTRSSAGAAKQPVPESQLEAGGFSSVSNSFVYDSKDVRDPFRSWGFVKPVRRSEDGGPLVNFELGQLDVVAVVWSTGRPRAMVSDPAGRSFLVREGTRIGKNDGRVIHIGDNLVLVKETYVDFTGDRTTKDVELRIRRSQGG